MGNKFLNLHKELNKDAETLIFHIERVSAKIKEDDKDVSDEQAYMQAIILLSYPYNNKKTLSQEELHDTFNLMNDKINNKIH